MPVPLTATRVIRWSGLLNGKKNAGRPLLWPPSWNSTSLMTGRENCGCRGRRGPANAVRERKRWPRGRLMPLMRFSSISMNACEEMDTPADAAISQADLGQFEIKLVHGSDKLKAADDAGNGMHTHFSMLHAEGMNISDDSSSAGTDTMRHAPCAMRRAIAGCVHPIPDSSLMFTPHGNSYDRLIAGSHAPTGICWRCENRTTAVRVGGDVNPHLMTVAILGAALLGMDDTMKAPPLITGNACAQNLPEMPVKWGTAIDTSAASPLMRRIFPEELLRNLTLTRRQKFRHWAELSPEEQVELYLDTI